MLESVDNEIYNLYGERWYTAMDDPVALLRAQCRTESPWIVEKIFEHFLYPDIQILDIGCGAGFLTNDLAKQGFDVTGVDQSEESLEIAHHHDETGKVNYMLANAYNLPVPDKSFHVVTALDLLEHVERPQELINEVSRILKPGGIFMFHTFNRNPVAGLVVIKLVEWFIKNTPKNLHVLRLFIKPEELKAYCENAGLQMEEMKGLRPIVSSIPIKNYFTHTVPPGIRFKLHKSLLVSYIGCAVKMPFQKVTDKLDLFLPP